MAFRTRREQLVAVPSARLGLLHNLIRLSTAGMAFGVVTLVAFLGTSTGMLDHASYEAVTSVSVWVTLIGAVVGTCSLYAAGTATASATLVAGSGRFRMARLLYGARTMRWLVLWAAVVFAHILALTVVTNDGQSSDIAGWVWLLTPVVAIAAAFPLCRGLRRIRRVNAVQPFFAGLSTDDVRGASWEFSWPMHDLPDSPDIVDDDGLADGYATFARRAGRNRSVAAWILLFILTAAFGTSMTYLLDGGNRAEWALIAGIVLLATALLAYSLNQRATSYQVRAAEFEERAAELRARSERNAPRRFVLWDWELHWSRRSTELAASQVGQVRASSRR